MQLGEISFCDKVGYNIKSDDLKKRILRELESEYKFKVIQRHFAKYQSDQHDTILKNNPHMLCTKTNGNPYLLYLTKINFVNQCIFIDKKIQQNYHYPRMILSKFWFDDELFNNTLFEGEMVKDDDGHWTFLIGDLIADKGEILATQNLLKRLTRIHELLEKDYVFDKNINVCDFRVKKYFLYSELNHLRFEYPKLLNYSIRGIILKPLFFKFQDILYNFDDNLITNVTRTKLGKIFIEKKLDDPSFLQPTTQNLWVVKTDMVDIYHIYDDENNKLGNAFVNTLKLSKMLQNEFLNSRPNEKKKMVCRFNEKFKKWEPVG